MPRVRLKELWRVDEAYLEQAQDDATLIAIRDMERAGIDIITDGEMRRESYSNRFATALEGIDIDKPATVKTRAGAATEVMVPRVESAWVRRRTPVGATRHAVSPPLPRERSRQDHVARPVHHDAAGQERVLQGRRRAFLPMDYAVAVNEEARDLVKAGADVIQLDEPWLRNDPDAARRFAVKAINRALEGITVPTIVHLCFGYAFLVSNKPASYFFLSELADSNAQQISIEAAQPKIDLGLLKDLLGKKIMLGVINLGDQVSSKACRTSPIASFSRLKYRLGRTAPRSVADLA